MSDDYEINIDVEEAIDNYEEAIFEMNIKLFVEESYESNKAGMIAAVENRDEKKLKMLTHTLKTNVRYMCVENFAMECEAIENCTKDPPDWPKILSLFPTFLAHFEVLYKKVKKIYDDMYSPEKSISGIEEKAESASANTDNSVPFMKPSLSKESSYGQIIQGSKYTLLQIRKKYRFW
jgi:hypothetical protein